MGDLSRSYSRSEFECQCGCGQDTVDVNLIPVLQHTVDYFQNKNPTKKIRGKITSGNRCVSHNKSIGGSEKSQHVVSKAADFYLYYLVGDDKVRIPADDVADYLEETYPNTLGVGRYKGRTHVDVRSDRARWDSR